MYKRCLTNLDNRLIMKTTCFDRTLEINGGLNKQKKRLSIGK